MDFGQSNGFPFPVSSSTFASNNSCSPPFTIRDLTKRHQGRENEVRDENHHTWCRVTEGDVTHIWERGLPPDGQLTVFSRTGKSPYFLSIFYNSFKKKTLSMDHVQPAFWMFTRPGTRYLHVNPCLQRWTCSRQRTWSPPRPETWWTWSTNPWRTSGTGAVKNA